MSLAGSRFGILAYNSISRQATSPAGMLALTFRELHRCSRPKEDIRSWARAYTSASASRTATAEAISAPQVVPAAERKNTVRFKPPPLCHGEEPVATPRKRPSIISIYAQLAKPRLTALIVLSAMSSYAIAPGGPELGLLEGLSALGCLTIGTALTSASANALNMAREPEFDGMMARTRRRPIVRGLVTREQAVMFAIVSGLVGAAVLYFGVNETVSILAVFNIALYAGLYTSMKRTSIVNTWVGAVVGAIPPLMGWVAVEGAEGLLEPGAWCLAGLLYAWQFPHFNALSYNMRDEYRNAGYRMAAWTNPALNARVALRYSVAMIPLCLGMTYFGVTDRVFVIDSSIMNAWLIWCAVPFWVACRTMPSASAVASGTATLVSKAAATAASTSARQLFFASILQLPAVLVLAMVHKSGQWAGVWTALESLRGGPGRSVVTGEAD
ncbi:UbiA prenyltransferase family-domain-containing protein [Lipomyces oligophaga]|uniref:UbiA prenyltransferase family-domain-containing protein n=1 Tax=Lipomyces oligophaga TaxID=45792 RepID=UPI0034CE252E